jgi:hypothetical protein
VRGPYELKCKGVGVNRKSNQPTKRRARGQAEPPDSDSSLKKPSPKSIFEQGLGLFGSPEDAALLDEVVAMAYEERRRPAK